MKKNRLGQSEILVSELCLGTMTFGTQTNENDAHEQIDLALESGINFIDTAEMYPVNPISKDTIGKTEMFIGNWNAMNSHRRSDYILATKHSGEGLKHTRDGAPISKNTIEKTIEESLKRLRTDYIDLYQFHWPNRGSYMFRKNWNYDPSSQNKQKTIDNMLECLKALEVQVQKGNIRYFGLSNESAWGTAQWLRLSEVNSLPRVQTIQNEYSLLCRLYDTDLAELSLNEDVGLLAFSALATGLLTGKYQNNKVPVDSRKSISPELGGRVTDRVWLAVEKYMEISAKYQIDPIHLSIAWCSSRPFMCSTIIGATNVNQLSHILGSQDVEISEECLIDIDNAHKEVPMPF